VAKANFCDNSKFGDQVFSTNPTEDIDWDESGQPWLSASGSLRFLIIINRHQADLNGLAGGSAVAIVGGISALLVGTVFLSPLVYIGGSASDVRSRWLSGANPPVSISVSPSQPWLSLRCPERDLRSTARNQFLHSCDMTNVVRFKLAKKATPFTGLLTTAYFGKDFPTRGPRSRQSRPPPPLALPARFICSGTNAGRRWTCYNERYNRRPIR